MSHTPDPKCLKSCPRCCNSHEALVAALEEPIMALDSVGTDHELFFDVFAWGQRARAAIALAKGETP